MNSASRDTKKVMQVITFMIGLTVLAFICFDVGFVMAFRTKAVLVILTIFAISFVLRRIARQPN